MEYSTKHGYQKRIKELETEIDRLRPFRDFTWQLHSALVEVMGRNSSLSNAWLVNLLWKVVK